VAVTLFFYDLETSGLSPRNQRVMQFAGQRTSLQLEPIGEPANVLIKLPDDLVPSPDAILITGITPQMTQQEGLTEAEFLRFFNDEIAVPDTVFVGYNTIRFDDEFMRFLLYRNFYDPYEWEWKDGRGRWDLLDVIRMTRALRPEGITWPVTDDGAPTNRLELLTAANKLQHEGAHDALQDVKATISLAQLLHVKQPKLFEYLLSLRTKAAVQTFVEANALFVYSSGKYASAYEKTAIVSVLGKHPNQQGVLVYDTRYDPTEFLDMSAEELAERWRFTKQADAPIRLPVKLLQYNRCPAIAPLNTILAETATRLNLDLTTAKKYADIIQKQPKFYASVCKALELLDGAREKKYATTETDVDEALYNGFFNDTEKPKMSSVRAADPALLNKDFIDFKDERLRLLLPRYKARNYPALLSETEYEDWQIFRRAKLKDELNGLPAFFKRLDYLSRQTNLNATQRYLLEELQLYGQSIMPELE
jgi:exodeoxyribonuclease I